MSLHGDIRNFSVGVATKGSHVRRLAKSTENKAYVPWLRLSWLSLVLCIELKHALLLIHMELVLNQILSSLILKKAVKMHHYCLCLACFKPRSLINKISYSYINISMRWKCVIQLRIFYQKHLWAWSCLMRCCRMKFLYSLDSYFKMSFHFVLLIIS